MINSKKKQPVADLMENAADDFSKAENEVKTAAETNRLKAKEINGPKGLEPTRYGDWESKGRCYDF